MRQAGDVLFSQVFRDRGGKLDWQFVFLFSSSYKGMNNRSNNWAVEVWFYILAICDQLCSLRSESLEVQA
jgi:hypothetical protein